MFKKGDFIIATKPLVIGMGGMFSSHREDTGYMHYVSEVLDATEFHLLVKRATDAEARGHILPIWEVDRRGFVEADPKLIEF